MGRRGGRRRKREPLGEPTLESPSPRQSLEVFVEEGSSDTVESPAQALSFPPAVPLSSILHPTDHAELQRLQDCWFQVAQRKGKKQLIPTPIQRQSWSLLLPELLNNEDGAPHGSQSSVLGLAPTGGGKTLAYGVPLLLRASRSGSKEDGLILVPTRELASQVGRELRLALTPSMRRGDAVRIVVIHGGVDKQEQRMELSQNKRNHGGRMVVVATPGRLVDLLSESLDGRNDGDLSKALSNVTGVVLDEADRLAMNRDIAQQIDEVLRYLTSKIAAERTMCLFSATFPERIRAQWAEWVPGRRICIKVNSVTVGSTEKSASEVEHKDTETSLRPSEPCTEGDCGKGDTDAGKNRHHAGGPVDLAQIPSHIAQTLHVCAAHKKPRKLITTLSKIRQQERHQRRKSLCLVFFAKIKTLQYVHKLLVKEGVKCAEFHSHMAQNVREAALHNFRSGKIPTLLATDIAARGIHCNNIEHVINYDFPGTMEQYVHRCGRAGRNQAADESGNPSTTTSSATVYSFFTRNLAPIASDVVALLRSCNAWVDPNLVALIESVSPTNDPEVGGNKRVRQSSSGREARSRDSSADGTHHANKVSAYDEAIESEDDGQFRYLNPKRIKLQRASHVSDASDDEGNSSSDKSLQ